MLIMFAQAVGHVEGGTPRIAVVPGSFDDIGAILARMGIDYDTLAVGDFAANAANYDVIFVNCAARPPYHAIRDFVASGETLYASDLSIAPFRQAFGEHVDFWQTWGHDFNAIITDIGLAIHMGSLRMEVVNGWSAFATRIPGHATVYLAHPTMDFPAAFSFEYGEGKVFYTSFHNSVQATHSIERFLEYLVFSMMHVDHIANLTAMATAAGYTFEGTVFESLMPGESSLTFSYTPTAGHDFRLLLDPTMGDFTLHLIDPLGRVYTNEGMGIVDNYGCREMLPASMPASSMLDMHPGDNLRSGLNGANCCGNHEDHERLARLSGIPFVEPIIPEYLPVINTETTAIFATSDDSDMVVTSLGREGLAVANPIQGEWQFIVTSNNSDSTVFAVGIAERPSYSQTIPDPTYAMEFTFDALSYVVHGAESIFITVEAREDVPFMPVIFLVNEDGTRTDVSDMIAEVTYSNGLEYNTISGSEWGMLSFYESEVWVTVKLVDGTVLSSYFSYTIEVVVG